MEKKDEMQQEQTQRAQTQQEQTQQEQGEKLVRVMLPKDAIINKGDMFVSVNMKEYRLPRGKPIEVPESVAGVIADALAQEDESLRYAEENVNVRYN